MDEGTRKVSFPDLIQDPAAYTGKLFILGGLIVNTKLTEKGSEIEALYVPVDSKGRLEEYTSTYGGGRYLAIYPKAQGILDPVIYKQGREISIAGIFTGTQKGKINEMEYTYPVFEIRQLYLWPEEQYYMAPAYPYPYPYWWYGPPGGVPGRLRRDGGRGQAAQCGNKKRRRREMLAVLYFFEKSRSTDFHLAISINL